MRVAPSHIRMMDSELAERTDDVDDVHDGRNEDEQPESEPRDDGTREDGEASDSPMSDVSSAIASTREYERERNGLT